jgi:DNA repair protein RadC
MSPRTGILSSVMAVRIADLPASERPRERLARLGPVGLSDQELLALVIRSGSRGVSATDVGTDLLGAWGSLSQLSLAGMDDLDGMLSLGSAKAAGLVAAFELGRRAAFGPVPVRIRRPEDLVSLVQPLLAGRPQEEVVLVVTNTANRVLRTMPVTRGSADRCLLVVRDVISAVLRCGGAAFAVAHNHPSGDPTPSPEDRAVTQRLRNAAETVGLRFLDHIVVAGSDWRSTSAEPA